VSDKNDAKVKSLQESLRFLAKRTRTAKGSRWRWVKAFRTRGGVPEPVWTDDAKEAGAFVDNEHTYYLKDFFALTIMTAAQALDAANGDMKHDKGLK
jgi:hypothetical protein